jgi:hypothetical protein
MSWYGSVRTATGGKLRHKVQSVVIASVLLTATASATLGFALLAASDAPFQHAFAAQRGADVTLTANPRLASTAQLDATRSLRGVTAGSGPFPQVIAQIEQGGEPWGPTTLVGRPAPSGPVDDLVLNAGHWVTGPGQIVLSGTPANQGLSTGAKLTVTGVPGNPVLVVVGFANSITDSGDGWVAPAEIAALGTRQNPVSQQLLYRFSQAATNAQIRSDIKEVTAALPPGAVTGNADWLAQETQNSGPAATMEPFVVAFAFIGLVLAVLIVGNVISGAVVAGYQRIGVLKSIGLTPAQVVATYLIRVGWPAVAGHPGTEQVRRRLQRGQPASAGVGDHRRAARHAHADHAGGAGPRAARRTALRHAGDRGRPGAEAWPRLRPAPAHYPARSAPPGRHRAGGAVRQARQDRGDVRRDRVRYYRADLRGRAAFLAEPRRGQPDPVRHGPGAGPAR